MAEHKMPIFYLYLDTALYLLLYPVVQHPINIFIIWRNLHLQRYLLLNYWSQPSCQQDNAMSEVKIFIKTYLNTFPKYFFWSCYVMKCVPENLILKGGNILMNLIRDSKNWSNLRLFLSWLIKNREPSNVNYLNDDYSLGGH